PAHPSDLHACPTRRSSDLKMELLGHARIVIIRRVGRESVEAQILGAPKLIVYVDRGIELATRAPAPRVQIPRAHVRHGEAVFRIEVAVWNDILTDRAQIHVEPGIASDVSAAFRAYLHDERDELDLLQGEVRVSFRQALHHP